MRTLIFVFFIFTSLSAGGDLYREFIKEKIREIPLKKAIILGKGEKELIVFMNPNCPHCRREWRKLKRYLDRIKIYLFLYPFKRDMSSYWKAVYIMCSEDKYKAVDEIFGFGIDRSDYRGSVRCRLKVEDHILIAEKFGVSSVPYNIILSSYEIIEGFSPLLLNKLGIR